VYHNTFTCIPARVPFRPERTTPVPEMPGVITATVESAGGDYAYLDDAGRYRAKMHFDRSGRTDGTASAPIRLAQPNTGPGYGVHLPNHAGTELVVAHVGGHPDRPLALGTVPNPSTTSPVAAENRMENVIRTFGGNELLMDDTSEAARVRLQSAGRHELLFDDQEDRVQLVTTGEHAVVLDDKNERIEVQTTKGHRVVMDDAGEAVQVVTTKGHHVTLSDAEGSVTVADAAGEHTLVLDFAAKVVRVKTTGDLKLEADEAVEIRGKSILMESQENTELSVGGDLRQEVSGSATLEAGEHVTAEAGQNMALEAGQNLTCEGTSNATVKAGKNLTAEGGTNATVKGGKSVKAEGGMSATVKGGTNATLEGMKTTVKGVNLKVG
jgi:type VI secretion system secreted protein VgrG